MITRTVEDAKEAGKAAAAQVAEEVRNSIRSERRRVRRRIRRGSRFGGVVWGGVLLIVGSFLLLERLGLEVPNLGALWPVFPLMFGLAFLASYFGSGRTDPGLVWPGTFGVLLGSFFFLFSFEIVEWEEMAVLWPMYPLMVGISFFATWLASRCRDSGALGTGVMTTLIGGVGLSMTTGFLAWGDWHYVWPLALVAIGAMMIFRSLRSSRRIDVP